MNLTAEVVEFAMARPLVITGYSFQSIKTVHVTLHDQNHRGVGESVGTYFLGETADSMLNEIRAIASELFSGITQAELKELMPACGARTAVDCALWDLRAKQAGKTIWDILGVVPEPLTTVFTLGIDEPDAMADAARDAQSYPQLKVKLDESRPVEKLEAIRQARPDAVVIVDVNQGWNFEELKEYAPALGRLGVAMIEQPLARSADEVLEGYRAPIPLGADESCLNLKEFETIRERYQVINVKLDKCGGLTEGLELVRAAQAAGKQVMVGNMMGSSLSMAPSFVIGLHSRFVDLDGPLLLSGDIEGGLAYLPGGQVNPPSPELWG
ncbi:MAG: dipeptide epimerase [Pseudomonadota bacterium]